MLYCNGQIEFPFEQFRRSATLREIYFTSTKLVLCNYKSGGPGLGGLLLDFTRKVLVHYMNMLKKSTLHLCIGLSKN